MAEGPRHEQPECQERRGHGARNRYVGPGKVADRERFFGHHHGAIAIAHAAAAGQQRVFVQEKRIRVNADRRDFQLAQESPAIKRLDILQLVAERQVAGRDLVVRQGVEHERIIRIGAMADGDQAFGHR